MKHNRILTLLFLLVLVDAAPKQVPEKRPEATRKEMRSTPLRGRLPKNTHTSPFPNDPSYSTFKNPTAKDGLKVKEPEYQQQGRTFCHTKECILAAGELLLSMNLTADPCEDFYAYTCGNWFLENPIPPTSNAMSVFHSLWGSMNERILGILSAEPSADDSEAVREAKTMYSACADTDTLESLGLEPLTSFMDVYGGGWPMTLSNWDAGSFYWQETAAAWVREVALDTLVAASVGPEETNTDRNVLHLGQASPTLSSRDSYLDRAIVSAYANLMFETAKLVRDHHGSGVSDDTIRNEVAAVVGFEISLAAIARPSGPASRLSLADLQNATDAGAPGVISWTKFLNAMFSSVGMTWDGGDEVVCSSTDFMADLADLLKRTPTKTIGNYLQWRLVFAVGEETSRAMRDLFFEFSKVVTGITEPPNREYECADLVNNLMGMAVGSVYVSKFFPPSAKQEVEQLVEDLRTAFHGILNSISWMDAATLKKAKEKNDAIRAFVGYPDFILDPEKLAGHYFGISVNSSTHLWNAFNLLGWTWRQQAAVVNKPVDRDAWITHPTIVNAFYYPSMNSITIPAGILQSPFYEKGRLAAMNYGGIGMVIGHEITHGFDNSGRLYDARGNLVNWWTPKTAETFKEKAQCFVDQYSGYEVPELSGMEERFVNGTLTLGENIADNGGVEEALLAFFNYIDRNGAEPSLPGLDFLTSEQLFFVTFAYNWCGHSTKEYLQNQILYDPHSPANFRVRGSLSNSAAFAKAFGCRADQPMVRGNDSCILWGPDESGGSVPSSMRLGYYFVSLWLLLRLGQWNFP